MIHAFVSKGLFIWASKNFKICIRWLSLLGSKHFLLQRQWTACIITLPQWFYAFTFCYGYVILPASLIWILHTALTQIANRKGQFIRIRSNVLSPHYVSKPFTVGFVLLPLLHLIHIGLLMVCDADIWSPLLVDNIELNNCYITFSKNKQGTSDFLQVTK
jgi:hypothetical protein